MYKTVKFSFIIPGIILVLIPFVVKLPKSIQEDVGLAVIIVTLSLSLFLVSVPLNIPIIGKLSAYFDYGKSLYCMNLPYKHKIGSLLQLADEHIYYVVHRQKHSQGYKTYLIRIKVTELPNIHITNHSNDKNISHCNL